MIRSKPRTAIQIAVFVAASGIAACGEDKSGPPGPLLEPPPAGAGVQIKMTSTLTAGLETERCMFYRVPADGFYVNREVIRYTPGSHHVLLYSTPYTEIPTQTIRGTTIDTTGVFDCGANGATGDWEVTGTAGGAQSADGPPTVDGLPADVAFKMNGGSVLLVNAHYLNASDKELEAEIYINLYTVPASQVVHEAGVIFMYNPFISVPPQGSAEAHEVCRVSKDVTLVNAQSHMHKRGVGYLANLVDPTTQTSTEIYSTTAWEAVVSRQMDPLLPLVAGQLIDFKCSYTNTEARRISQGRTTRDEMCMFLGLYYPRDTKTELCSMTDDAGGRYLGAVWVGSGAKTGLETVSCLQAATGASGAPGDLDACVVQSCPKISTQMSDATRCLATKGLGMCATACGGGDAAACSACVGTQCTPSMQALATASCT